MKKKRFRSGGLSLLIGIVILFFYVVGTFDPTPTQETLNNLVPLFGIILILLGLKNLNKEAEQPRRKKTKKR